MSIELVMPSSHLILCRPLLLLPSIPPSIRVFSNESALHMRWPKYCSFSFSISPSNEHPGLISFRMVGSPCSPRDSQDYQMLLKKRHRDSTCKRVSPEVILKNLKKSFLTGKKQRFPAVQKFSSVAQLLCCDQLFANPMD